MATLSKSKLSGSTSGRGIKVAATATAGTTIHTGSSTTTTLHEVWLWAVNSDTTARVLTIEWGGTSSPDDTINLTIEPNVGLVPVIPGMVIEGAASPLVVRAFADSANKVIVHGFVNVIAQ